MLEPIHFHSDLYRREALQSAAHKFAGKARIELAESNGHIVARLDPLAPMSDAEARELRDEFCTEALSLTVRRLREAGVPENPAPASVESALSEPERGHLLPPLPRHRVRRETDEHLPAEGESGVQEGFVTRVEDVERPSHRDSHGGAGNEGGAVSLFGLPSIPSRPPRVLGASRVPQRARSAALLTKPSSQCRSGIYLALRNQYI